MDIEFNQSCNICHNSNNTMFCFSDKILCNICYEDKTCQECLKVLNLDNNLVKCKICSTSVGIRGCNCLAYYNYHIGLCRKCIGAIKESYIKCYRCNVNITNILVDKKYGLYIPQKTKNIFCKSCIENNPIHGIKRRIYLSALINGVISFQSLKRGKIIEVNLEGDITNISINYINYVIPLLKNTNQAKGNTNVSTKIIDLFDYIKVNSKEKKERIKKHRNKQNIEGNYTIPINSRNVIYQIIVKYSYQKIHSVEFKIRKGNICNNCQLIIDDNSQSETVNGNQFCQDCYQEYYCKVCCKIGRDFEDDHKNC